MDQLVWSMALTTVQSQTVARLQGPSLGATTVEENGVPGVTETAWDQHKVSYKYPPLTQDASADVCVIGAGIFGACIAYSLQKAGAHTTPVPVPK